MGVKGSHFGFCHPAGRSFSRFTRTLARSRVVSSLIRRSGVLLSWYTWLIITTPLVGQSVSSAPPIRAPFHVPVVVGNARLRDSSFGGDAIVYSYEGGRIEGLDLYSWPIPSPNQLDSGRWDSLLRREVAKFKDVLLLGQQRGLWDDYRIVFEDSHRVPLDTDTLPGYVVAFVFTRRSQPFASFFYIYALEGMFLKIRLTVPADGWNTNPALDVPGTLVQALARKR